MPKIETKRIADLVPAPYNPREISDASLAGLAASVRRFGLVQPIIWNERTNRVVGGHQRLKVLETDGALETEVVVVDLPDREEKALNVALNSPEISGVFTEDLDALLEEIDAELPELFAELRLDALRISRGGSGDEKEEKVGEVFEYAVIVECENEERQRELLATFEREGLKCRPLIL